MAINQLLAMLASQTNRKRYVELTTTGPVLTQSNIEVTSLNTINTYEVDEATWDRLQEVLQTGELDNAKVEEIIKVQQ